jgi:tRNA threonylcarbamoyladenosine biosynthesis protein TsaE
VDRYIGTEQLVESAEAMKLLGASIALELRAGQVVLLHGDLGAGKTTLSQGIAAGLGIKGAVTSPTFTLVGEYPIEPPRNGISRLNHLDLYRLVDPAELDSFGFDEFLAPEGGVTIIEWPERAEGRLPPDAIVIEIEPVNAGSRRVRFRLLG